MKNITSRFCPDCGTKKAGTKNRLDMSILRYERYYIEVLPGMRYEKAGRTRTVALPGMRRKKYYIKVLSKLRT